MVAECRFRGFKVCENRGIGLIKVIDLIFFYVEYSMRWRVFESFTFLRYPCEFFVRRSFVIITLKNYNNNVV